MKFEPTGDSNPANDSEEILKPRPNPCARWQCGLRDQGMECHAGPAEDGTCCQVQKQSNCENGSREACESNCPAAAMCQLTRLRGGVSMDEVDLGPCVPTRVAWFARETLALNVGVLIGGLLLVCMAIPQRETVFVPGPLSHSHSQILGNVVVSERCSQCHPNSHSQADSQGAAGIVSNRGRGVTQSDLCLKCHGEHLPNAHAKLPHDLSAMQFASLRGKEMVIATDASATECATCHVEHGGVHKDIKQITDARCQSCHQSTFASFSNGHPEFKNYPRQLERSIVFDHSRHRRLHFAKKGEEYNCASCHVESNDGQERMVTSVVSFEQACARCHSESLKANASDGWAFVEIPSINSSDAQADMLNWPRSAQFGREGKIGIAARILLAADPNVSRSIGRLSGEGDLTSLLEDDKAGHESFFAIASGMRSLVSGIAHRGQAEISDRLTAYANRQLQRELTVEEQHVVQRVAVGLPPDLFSTAYQAWFGETKDVAYESEAVRVQMVSGTDDLLLDDATDKRTGSLAQDDLVLHEDGLLVPQQSKGDAMNDDALLLGNLSEESQAETGKKPAFTTAAERLGHGGWYIDHQTLSIRYLPVGHSDPTLAAWIDYCAMVNEPLVARKKSLDASSDHGQTGAVIAACIECHQPQRRGDSSFVAWDSQGTVEQSGGFTKFSHRPHLTLTLTRDCVFCHRETNHGELNQVQLAKTSAAVDDFQPIELQQCNSCHRPNGASEGCTQCHNYHVHPKSIGSSR